LLLYKISSMEKTTKKTLVLGASDNPQRYSYLALNRLQQSGHPVMAIGKKNTTVNGISIGTEQEPASDIDTITLYLNPAHQKEYYNYILSLKPKRIIFNPGTENNELEDLAKANNIQPLRACTLVLLGTGQF
jgi:uncharacterized protein